MAVERSGELILGIHDNPGNGQHCTGLNNLMASVGEQDGAQPFPTKLRIYSEPTDECDRYGIARQFARQRLWQIAAIHAARAQGVEAGQLFRPIIGRNDESTRHVFPYIL